MILALMSTLGPDVVTVQNITGLYFPPPFLQYDHAITDFSFLHFLITRDVTSVLSDFNTALKLKEIKFFFVMVCQIDAAPQPAELAVHHVLLS
jgi:hypothetical protein